ncbi:MAG: ABC transporter substrate-binding protein [Candidatus Hodarchaeota archaeon]
MTTTRKIIVLILLNLILYSPYIYYKDSFYETSTKSPTEISSSRYESTIIPTSLRVGVITPDYFFENNFSTFDPIAIGWDYDFRRNSLIYEALVQYNPETGDLSPVLATQWVVSKDGKHWTFDLKENVIFHDGSKFNATSVKWNYDRLINPDHPAYVQPAPYITHHSIPFDSVEILDEFKVTIHLKESDAAFIHESSNIQLASPNSFNGSDLVSPLGTGPYIRNSTFFNGTIQNTTFVRFPEYHQGLAPFEQIEYIMKEDFTEEINTHALDIVIPYNKFYETLKTDPYWSLNITNDKDSFELGFINHQRKYLKDPKVRMAINYAIDRQDYIEKMNWTEIAEPMTNLIPPGFLFHKYSDGFPYNVTKANELLDKAGYPRAKDGYRFWLVLVGPELLHPEIIGEYLKEIGIWPYILTPEDWTIPWIAGDYDLLLLSTNVYNDPDFSRIFLHSSSLFNTGKFADPKFDYLLSEGIKTPIRQEREYFYFQLQPLIQVTAPYIYLSYINNIYAIKTDLVPYIFVNKAKQLYFNYSLSLIQPLNNLKYKITQYDLKTQLDLNFYTNIEVTDHPIYFPRTDCIVTPLEEHLIVNISMSHNLGSYLPVQEGTGKFIYLTTNDGNNPFRLRCYYDVEEMSGKSHNQLKLYLYNEEDKTWTALKNEFSNATFRYLEVELTGKRNLIRFDEFFQKTFKLVPFFAIAIGGLVVSAFLIVIYNVRKTKYIRGRIQS